jgi:hypothetical protein
MRHVNTQFATFSPRPSASRHSSPIRLIRVSRTPLCPAASPPHQFSAIILLWTPVAPAATPHSPAIRKARAGAKSYRTPPCPLQLRPPRRISRPPPPAASAPNASSRICAGKACSPLPPRDPPFDPLRSSPRSPNVADFRIPQPQFLPPSHPGYIVTTGGPRAFDGQRATILARPYTSIYEAIGAPRSPRGSFQKRAPQTQWP